MFFDKVYRDKKLYANDKKRVVNGITLMIIPHSQKHVFRLHFNYHHLFFALGLLASITVFAVLSGYYNRTYETRQVLEAEKMRIWSNRIWNFNNGQERIARQINLLNAAGNSYYYSIWNRPYHEIVADDFEVNAKNFDDLTAPLVRALDFLIAREKAFLQLPLGWPVDTAVVTSEFGTRLSPFGLSADFHAGYDFANTIGTPILATAPGKVIFAGRSSSGYGRYVKILHAYGFVTLYGHASAVKVTENQMVERGDVIALLGQSGSATGPHIHYEVRMRHEDGYEMIFNPLPYITETP